MNRVNKCVSYPTFLYHQYACCASLTSLPFNTSWRLCAVQSGVFQHPVQNCAPKSRAKHQQTRRCSRGGGAARGEQRTQRTRQESAAGTVPPSGSRIHRDARDQASISLVGIPQLTASLPGTHGRPPGIGPALPVSPFYTHSQHVFLPVWWVDSQVLQGEDHR